MKELSLTKMETLEGGSTEAQICSAAGVVGSTMIGLSYGAVFGGLVGALAGAAVGAIWGAACAAMD